MDQFSLLLSQGAAQAWWYLPTALGIGALHGLEPGHSKSLMAAFIIAVRGTWQQAMLLGLCVAISHSLVVWLIAGVGLYYGEAAQALLSEALLRRRPGHSGGPMDAGKLAALAPATGWAACRL